MLSIPAEAAALRGSRPSECRNQYLQRYCPGAAVTAAASGAMRRGQPASRFGLREPRRSAARSAKRVAGPSDPR